MNEAQGWLTFHEVLEATGLSYTEVMDHAEKGLIASRSSGAAVLYDVDDVNRLTEAKEHPEQLEPVGEP